MILPLLISHCPTYKVSKNHNESSSSFFLRCNYLRTAVPGTLGTFMNQPTISSMGGLPWLQLHQYFMFCSINYAKKIWKGHTNIKFLPTSLLLSSLNSSDSGLLVALKLFRNWNATGVFRCFGSFRTTSSS